MNMVLEINSGTCLTALYMQEKALNLDQRLKVFTYEYIYILILAHCISMVNKN